VACVQLLLDKHSLDLQQLREVEREWAGWQYRWGGTGHQQRLSRFDEVDQGAVACM
jgi:hypothetical protein